MTSIRTSLVLVGLVVGVGPVLAQYPVPGRNFSSNLHLVTHVPLDGAQQVSDI